MANGGGADEVEVEVDARMAAGEQFADAEDYAAALAEFSAAWVALLEPKDGHEQAVPVLAGIADCCFFLRRWDDCRAAVQQAFFCGGDMSNPFLRLRLGQSLFELGDEREAANWMVPVYLEHGRAPFEREDEKYLESFRGRLAPPPEGW